MRQHIARTSRNSVSRGFTMIEMMLVMVIIGVLMGVAVFQFGGFTTTARINQTKARLKQIGAALQNYEATNNINPPDLFTLTNGPTAQLTKSALKDGWKEDWVYYPTSAGGNPQHTFDLFSKGPDRLPNTSDDLDFWILADSAE